VSRLPFPPEHKGARSEAERVGAGVATPPEQREAKGKGAAVNDKSWKARKARHKQAETEGSSSTTRLLTSFREVHLIGPLMINGKLGPLFFTIDIL
jgi:hypothetical protein